MIMYDEGDISSHKPCKYARLSSLRGKVHNCTIGYKGQDPPVAKGETFGAENL